MGDDDEEQGGDVDGEDGAQQSPGKYVSYFDAIGKAALHPVSTKKTKKKTFQCHHKEVVNSGHSL